MKSKRVVLIGPVLPFRGGIAQHTTMLRRALSKICTLKTISFSRQYPQVIFPGESDIDPSFKEHLEDEVEYAIDSLNPYTWYKAVSSILKFKPEIVIIPWWTIFWFFCFFYIQRRLLKNNINVYFLCHNVIEHETAFWKKFLTRLLLNKCDNFIVQTEVDKNNLNTFLPGKNILKHPHPIYSQFPAAKKTLAKRANLELLFYGFVRPYKGLEVLLSAMKLIKRTDSHLSIVGEFWDSKEETADYIIKNNLESVVEIIPRYVTDQETAEYFQRADVVILPYKSATGTGVIPIAYHYNKPVIVTNVGGLPDVVSQNNTGWIIESNSPQALANSIDSLSVNNLDKFKTNIIEYKKSLSWDHMAKEILTMNS